MPEPKLPYDKLKLVRLTQEHDLSGFECEVPELADYLKEDALSDLREHYTTTHLVIYYNYIVGYFTLYASDFIILKLPNKSKYDTIPAIQIARLATHINYKNRGIGHYMMCQILRIIVECSNSIVYQVITVTAKKSAQSFYTRYGFDILEEIDEDGEKMARMYSPTLPILMSLESSQTVDDILRDVLNHMENSLKL